MRKMLVFAALTTQLFAGGSFYLQLGNPEASTEAKKANAVLTVKATGCAEPAKAQITATAFGTVNGKRQAIPLTLTPMPEAGMYALTQQWPKEGKWVIGLVGSQGPNWYTSTLVTAGPEGVDRYHAKSEMKKFSAADIDAMLK